MGHFITDTLLEQRATAAAEQPPQKDAAAHAAQSAPPPPDLSQPRTAAPADVPPERVSHNPVFTDLNSGAVHASESINLFHRDAAPAAGGGERAQPDDCAPDDAKAGRQLGQLSNYSSMRSNAPPRPSIFIQLGRSFSGVAADATPSAALPASPAGLFSRVVSSVMPGAAASVNGGAIRSVPSAAAAIPHVARQLRARESASSVGGERMSAVSVSGLQPPLAATASDAGRRTSLQGSHQFGAAQHEAATPRLEHGESAAQLPSAEALAAEILRVVRFC